VKFPAPKLQTLGAFYLVCHAAHANFKLDIDTKGSKSMVHNQDWLELDTVLVQRRTQCTKFRNRQCLNTEAHFESHIAAVHESEFL
jgi:hypothetical protein